MKQASSIVLSFLLLGIVALSPTQAYAYEIKNEKEFVQKLAAVFNLDENQVRAFLDLYKKTSPTPTPSKKVEINIETTAGKLAFLDEKFSKAVKDKKMTNAQKNAVMSKLKSMMKTTPSSKQFEKMSAGDQQEAINKWKKVMEPWAQSQGLTLDKLRDITGKGNKFLMGIYY